MWLGERGECRLCPGGQQTRVGAALKRRGWVHLHQFILHLPGSPTCVAYIVINAGRPFKAEGRSKQKAGEWKHRREEEKPVKGPWAGEAPRTVASQPGGEGV